MQEVLQNISKTLTDVSEWQEATQNFTAPIE